MKGTPAKGKNNKKATHIICRRCGKRSFHRIKGVCSSCGYGRSSRKRKFRGQQHKK